MGVCLEISYFLVVQLSKNFIAFSQLTVKPSSHHTGMSRVLRKIFVFTILMPSERNTQASVLPSTILTPCTGCHFGEWLECNAY